MSPVTEKPLSKAAQKKAERAARKAERIAKKAQEQLALQQLRERAQRLCAAPPSSFQTWGVTRTQAFLKFVAITKHKAALKTIKSPRLAEFVFQLEKVNDWPLDFCQHVTTLSDTAADFCQS